MEPRQLVRSLGWRVLVQCGHTGRNCGALGDLDQRLAAGRSRGMLKYRIRSFCLRICSSAESTRTLSCMSHSSDTERTAMGVEARKRHRRSEIAEKDVSETFPGTPS